MQIWCWPRDRKAIAAHFAAVDETPRAIEAAVEAIIEDVRRDGDAALARYGRKFDKVDLKPGQFEVPRAALAAAWAAAPARLRRTLQTAKRRIEQFHRRQRLAGWTVEEPGFGRIEQRVLPLERVGVYVPAGEAPLVSTVLMDVIPARVAGVDEICLFTPPRRDGQPDGGILAAAHLAGVDRVFRLGSAWAVAAAAFGTETVPRVDKVVGPGNAYVTTAKQRLFGRIDIESTAGVSEVLILADATARLEHIAADLLAQAEHSGDNPCGVILIGGDRKRAEALRRELARRLGRLERGEMAARSIARHGYIILVKTAEEAIELANRKAPEHLEIIARGARRMARQVRHAGAIFVGPWTPEPLGDYLAGPNHTLPTGGTARFFSPLSVWSFYRTSHTIEATREGLAKLADDIILLAEAEGLTAHAETIRARFEPGSEAGGTRGGKQAAPTAGKRGAPGGQRAARRADS